jgi:hypothetical protein
VLDRGPLVARHGAGARVRKEVDEDVVGVQAEEVVARLAIASAGARESSYGQLVRVDAEGLEDGLEHAGVYRGTAALSMISGGPAVRSRVL